MPPSTVQKRRTALECLHIVKKCYEIEARAFSLRTANLLISVEKGDCVDIAKRLLAENSGIELTSDFIKKINKDVKYSDRPRVLEASIRIRDPVVIVIARVIYKSSQDLFSIIQELKKMPNMTRVEWAEIAKVVEKNNASVLPHSFPRISTQFNL
jgi:hypothetical protein